MADTCVRKFALMNAGDQNRTSAKAAADVTVMTAVAAAAKAALAATAAVIILTADIGRTVTPSPSLGNRKDTQAHRRRARCASPAGASILLQTLAAPSSVSFV